MENKSTEHSLLEEFVIRDAETLKVLAHPQRLEILRNFDKPRTVKEVAERIEADPTKLYYHVRMMDKAGIIRVTETNVVSGIIEKQYQVVARGYRVAEELVKSGEFSSDEMDQIIASVFDHTRYEMKRSQREGLLKLDEEFPNQTTALSSSHAKLTSEQLVEFNTRMKALYDDVTLWTRQNEPDKDGTTSFIFTLAFFPLVDSAD